MEGFSLKTGQYGMIFLQQRSLRYLLAGLKGRAIWKPLLGLRIGEIYKKGGQRESMKIDVFNINLLPKSMCGELVEASIVFAIATAVFSFSLRAADKSTLSLDRGRNKRSFFLG